CGSGQLLSDILSGRTPAIPYDDLSVARYRSDFTPTPPQRLHSVANPQRDRHQINNQRAP
ncbi:hypothetical protein MJN76_31060, partial [Salmonella enterica subsp. enterica serovar Anatum]|nr:hypothetical protein [Salmonella enterica subsp. enterica serovar Anatum]